jgi:hypothetical protein
MPLALSGDGAVGPLSATEVGYLDGVSSSVQTQLTSLQSQLTTVQSQLAGTGGLVMVTPTTIANSGGTATLTAGAVAFSGVTSVSLNGVFTSTYQNYFIVANVQNSAAQDVLFRLRVAGTDNSTNNYRTAYAYTSSATAWTVGQANPGTFGYALYAGNFPTLSNMNLGNPQSASETSGVFQASSSSGAPTVGLSFNSFRKDDSNQYDGITFYLASGNMTGTIRVYGYRNGI